jgi:primosomal protein N' (replication factor Y)
LKRTVKVLLPLPLADAYDYSLPDGLDVVAGHFVIVPLGKRETLGVVWGEGSGEVAPEKLRDIADILPALPMADALRRFVDWVAAYTLAPPGAVLRMAMSVPSALEAPKTEIVTGPRYLTMRAEVDIRAPPCARAAEGRPRHAGWSWRICRRRHVSDQDHGLIGCCKASSARCRLLPAARRQRQGPRLARAGGGGARTGRLVLAHAFSATLLDGVPGAGKTEVYSRAIAAALAAGRQVLVLLPEIALTAQWLSASRTASALRQRGIGPDQPERRETCVPSPRAGWASWSAHARRCSCPSPPWPDRGRREHDSPSAGRRRHLQCARHGRRTRPAGLGADRARLGDASLRAWST